MRFALAIGCSLIAAGAVASFAKMGAAVDTFPEREAFQRPAGLVASAAIETDPVWRLGRDLFFDPILSASGRTSCATCHLPDRGWSDGLTTSLGDDGQHLATRTPTLLNVGTLDVVGWAGTFADTADVSLFAIRSPINMRTPLDELGGRIVREPRYAQLVEAAFPHAKITADEIGQALARYVNSLTSAPAAFDRWIGGDDGAIDDSAKRGFRLFAGKARCSECHSGWTLTDGSFHDIGVSTSDLGRGKLFPTSLKLQYAFKTPTLRNVADRAPYMHDGSKATLEDVIELYDRGGIARPSRAEAIAPLHLSKGEKTDLIAFLRTLSGDTMFVAAK